MLMLCFWSGVRSCQQTPEPRCVCQGRSVTASPPAAPPPLVCRAGQFRCADGERCLPDYLACDGRPDCRDASDEADCGQ